MTSQNVECGSTRKYSGQCRVLRERECHIPNYRRRTNPDTTAHLTGSPYSWLRRALRQKLRIHSVQGYTDKH